MSIETEIIVGTLTSDDVKALRQCDRVAISHTRRNVGSLRCIKALAKRGPFDDSEREHAISCDSRVTDYTGDSIADVRPFATEYKCFALAYCYRHQSSHICTLAAFVRAGDMLRLEWCGSGNGYTREAGLHNDTVDAVIKRGNAEYRFRLDDSITPNNLARMIRAQ